eukprot:TRINITY_DN6270_c0_g1_i1.p1 TRINITY_DN6270_c0_g1~~TRINITY_DN6270_c0_g1_i1.p1  ORF type:complete len:1436 (+),score=176.88 TRINITY_DN6270_c0_g1_i1:55-4362(+)
MMSQQHQYSSSSSSAASSPPSSSLHGVFTWNYIPWGNGSITALHWHCYSGHLTSILAAYKTLYDHAGDPRRNFAVTVECASTASSTPASLSTFNTQHNIFQLWAFWWDGADGLHDEESFIPSQCAQYAQLLHQGILVGSSTLKESSIPEQCAMSDICRAAEAALESWIQIRMHRNGWIRLGSAYVNSASSELASGLAIKLDVRVAPNQPQLIALIFLPVFAPFETVEGPSASVSGACVLLAPLGLPVTPLHSISSCSSEQRERVLLWWRQWFHIEDDQVVRVQLLFPLHPEHRTQLWVPSRALLRWNATESAHHDGEDDAKMSTIPVEYMSRSFAAALGLSRFPSILSTPASDKDSFFLSRFIHLFEENLSISPNVSAKVDAWSWQFPLQLQVPLSQHSFASASVSDASADLSAVDVVSSLPKPRKRKRRSDSYMADVLQPEDVPSEPIGALGSTPALLDVSPPQDPLLETAFSADVDDQANMVLEENDLSSWLAQEDAQSAPTISVMPIPSTAASVALSNPESTTELVPAPPPAQPLSPEPLVGGQSVYAIARQLHVQHPTPLPLASPAVEYLLPSPDPNIYGELQTSTSAEQPKSYLSPGDQQVEGISGSAIDALRPSPNPFKPVLQLPSSKFSLRYAPSSIAGSSKSASSQSDVLMEAQPLPLGFDGTDDASSSSSSSSSANNSPRTEDVEMVDDLLGALHAAEPGPVHSSVLSPFPSSPLVRPSPKPSTVDSQAIGLAATALTPYPSTPALEVQTSPLLRAWSSLTDFLMPFVEECWKDDADALVACLVWLLSRAEASGAHDCPETAPFWFSSLPENSLIDFIESDAIVSSPIWSQDQLRSSVPVASSPDWEVLLNRIHTTLFDECARVPIVHCETTRRPQFNVGYGDELCSVDPEGILWWEKIAIRPYSPEKQIQVCIVAPASAPLRNILPQWSQQLSLMFSQCQLGSIAPATSLMSAISAVYSKTEAVDITSGILWVPASDSRPQSFVDACRIVGECIRRQGHDYDRSLLLLLAYPSVSCQGMMSEVVKDSLIALRGTSFTATPLPLKSPASTAVSTPAFICEAISCEFFLSVDAFSPLRLRTYSLRLYSKCRRVTFPQPIVSIARGPKQLRLNEPAFLVDTDSVTTEPLSPNTLFVAYQLISCPKKNWLVCSWSDARGELLDIHIEPGHIVNNAECNWYLYCHLVWTLAQRAIPTTSDESWRVVITRVGCAMSNAELTEWQALYASQSAEPTTPNTSSTPRIDDVMLTSSPSSVHECPVLPIPPSVLRPDSDRRYVDCIIADLDPSFGFVTPPHSSSVPTQGVSICADSEYQNSQDVTGTPGPPSSVATAIGTIGMAGASAGAGVGGSSAPLLRLSSTQLWLWDYFSFTSAVMSIDDRQRALRSIGRQLYCLSQLSVEPLVAPDAPSSISLMQPVHLLALRRVLQMLT